MFLVLFPTLACFLLHTFNFSLSMFMSLCLFPFYLTFSIFFSSFIFSPPDGVSRPPTLFSKIKFPLKNNAFPPPMITDIYSSRTIIAFTVVSSLSPFEYFLYICVPFLMYFLFSRYLFSFFCYISLPPALFFPFVIFPLLYFHREMTLSLQCIFQDKDLSEKKYIYFPLPWYSSISSSRACVGVIFPLLYLYLSSFYIPFFPFHSSLSLFLAYRSLFRSPFQFPAFSSFPPEIALPPPRSIIPLYRPLPPGGAGGPDGLVQVPASSRTPSSATCQRIKICT
jgi:hypothetical protein